MLTDEKCSVESLVDPCDLWGFERGAPVLDIGAETLMLMIQSFIPSEAAPPDPHTQRVCVRAMSAVCMNVEHRRERGCCVSRCGNVMSFVSLADAHSIECSLIFFGLQDCVGGGARRVAHSSS